MIPERRRYALTNISAVSKGSLPDVPTSAKLSKSNSSYEGAGLDCSDSNTSCVNNLMRGTEGVGTKIYATQRDHDQQVSYYR